MDTELIVLGTASAMPVRERHFSACALRYGGDLLLFDCGEGTQYQLLRAGLKGPRLKAVFITHLHGDHWFGLPGLFSSLSLLRFAGTLTLVGPEGLSRALFAIPGLEPDRLPFGVGVVEPAPGFGACTVLETPAYRVRAGELMHGVFCAGYRFEENPRPGTLDVAQARALGVTDVRAFRALKAGQAVVATTGRVVDPGMVVGPEKPGRSFAYVTDTRPCAGGRSLAAGVDLLYHEATFGQDHLARALETHHATAREAAEVARDAGARRLLLGHFSARYPTPEPLVEEARAVFENTEAAEELKPYLLETVPASPEHAPRPDPIFRTSAP